jgi:hypothetical protein
MKMTLARDSHPDAPQAYRDRPGSSRTINPARVHYLNAGEVHYVSTGLSRSTFKLIKGELLRLAPTMIAGPNYSDDGAL